MFFCFFDYVCEINKAFPEGEVRIGAADAASQAVRKSNLILQPAAEARHRRGGGGVNLEDAATFAALIPLFFWVLDVLSSPELQTSTALTRFQRISADIVVPVSSCCVIIGLMALKPDAPAVSRRCCFNLRALEAGGTFELWEENAVN